MINTEAVLFRFLISSLRSSLDMDQLFSSTIFYINARHYMRDTHGAHPGKAFEIQWVRTVSYDYGFNYLLSFNTTCNRWVGLGFEKLSYFFLTHF